MNISNIMNNLNVDVQPVAAPNKAALPVQDASFEKNMQRATERASESRAQNSERGEKRTDDATETPKADEPQDAAGKDKVGKTPAEEKDVQDVTDEQTKALDAAAVAAALAGQAANAAANEVAAEQIGGTGEPVGAQENALFAVQNSGAVLVDEAAQTNTSSASDGNLVFVKQEQTDFVERVLGEIDTVVSNEAERTDPTQLRVQPEGEAMAGAQGYDIHKKQTGTEQLGQPAATFHDGNAVLANAQPDAVVTLPADAAQARQVVAQTLLDQVESAVTAEKSELFIKFKPDVLGGMQIHLSMTQEGLRAQIRTSDASVRGMIGAEMNQLTDSLRARGIEVVEMDVYYEQQTANNQFLDQQSGRWQEQQQQSGGRRRVEQLEESGYESMYERMIPTDEETQGVDYTA
ncbi:MAG: flagellar hook-length control protein FliK [Clostridia bacterium]|nr:flagellar hook-length control protein FliK [Clostridia bacterium]